ncbi:protein kinase domain-containing protein [Allocoleopsis sp.]|uniref:protein kinase domain-containing protein n=1 Tax=Allocoleopsis sp. TaxID=3088169 RepID=UPI002FD407CA
MNNAPNSSRRRPRYQMIRELGRNPADGRITYLARDNQSQQLVVIKQFVLAQSNTDGSDFKAYKHEIQALQELAHPAIPRYIDSVETKAGFCLVQEYKNVQSLAIPRHLSPDQIQQIAISVLEILVYLQSRIPAVIHRNIKPENILLDEQLNVSLVDFGVARISAGEVNISGIPAGTLGFMAPEQLYDRQLTEATDLYGLGATLLYLLIGTKSMAVHSLIHENGRMNFKHLLPSLSLSFGDWLEKMVEPKPKDRFPDASVALATLKSIPVSYLPNTVGELLRLSSKDGSAINRLEKIGDDINLPTLSLPEVKFNPLILEFKTKQLGEKLTQSVTVINSVPKTLLAGYWEVVTHENDLRDIGNSNGWIFVHPVKFKGNYQDCEISVDTSKLMANTTYSRQIILHTNSSQKTHTLMVRVDTSPLKPPRLSYISLSLLFAIAWTLTGFGAHLMIWLITVASTFGIIFPLVLIGIGFVAGFLAGVLLAAVGVKSAPVVKIALGVIGLVAITVSLLNGVLSLALTTLLGAVGLVIGFAAGAVIKNHKDRGFSLNFAVAIALLLTGLSMSLSTGLNIGLNGFLTLSTLLTGISLAAIFLYRHWQREKVLAEYRQSVQKGRLIKP